MAKQPRHPIGKVPYKETTQDHNIKVGVIFRVDEINMVADIKIITGGGDQLEIPLSQGMYGPRSFWGGVPEVNSLVILGYRQLSKNLKEAVILGYLPVVNRSGIRFDPFSTVDPAEVSPEDQAKLETLVGKTTRQKRLLLRPGDVGGMSSSGAELVLSKSLSMTNRAGDLIELRDADRTLVSQAVHRVESASGIKQFYGPLRRSAFFLPPDLFRSGTLLKDTTDKPLSYYGRDELQATGPGGVGNAAKFANADGQMLEVFNDTATFPAVTYSNGRIAHYPPDRPGLGVEGDESVADAYVEYRMEMAHLSDLTQDVLEEVDGFQVNPKRPYIELAMGTVVGNDLTETKEMRQYGKVLKYKIFNDFTSTQPGRFSTDEIQRPATAPDIESVTQAGAYLFRLWPIRTTSDQPFVAAISKQGKLFLNVPASQVEDYPSGSKNISAEMNFAGAVKAFIGASAPDRISAHITLAGGLHLDVGRDSKGNAVTITYHSATKAVYAGNPNEEDLASSIEVRGVKNSAITGAERKAIDGSKTTEVSGRYKLNADRVNVNAFQGASYNFGELNQLISGKSQLNYALQVLENIVAGGKISTIIAGGSIENILAGAKSTTVAAGAMTTTVPGGAYTVTVGTGALSISTAAGAVALSTAAGALSLAAGAGAMSLTAGLALNMTAATISMVAPQVLVGGPAAVLGVCRGLPLLPPGAPSLDWITGLPLQGSASFRSFL
jgi:hypothetical protein